MKVRNGDTRIYGPIITACLEGARERAIELVLNAAEGLMADAPARFPTLADAMDECRARLMAMALELGEHGFRPITTILGLAREVPTPKSSDNDLLSRARLDALGTAEDPRL